MKKNKHITCAVDDTLYSEVMGYAKKRNITKSAATRELIHKGLNDGSEPVKTTVTDTIDVDLTRRVERLEAKESKSWIKRKLGI